jgi:hypothetical protein
MMAELADIDPDPHLWPHRHVVLLCSQVKAVDSSADMSLNSDDSHQLSISGQGVQHVSMAKLKYPLVAG